jgi:hypothetical protein
MIPSSDDNLQSGSVPPALSPPSNPRSGSARQLFALLLSLGLAVFLVDAVISFIDDSLIFLAGLHGLSRLRGLISFFCLLVTILIYGLIGLTPMVPKRLFLPIPVFGLVATLGVFPVLIYNFDRPYGVSWFISICQVVVGLWILYQSRGGLDFRWPLVPVDRLGARSFSWLNLSVFVLVNIFVLLPAVVVYFLICTALAVNHFSEGFMALRPDGVSVQVRKYVRDDGKTIGLFPMAHIADARFYHRVSQSFPTNSIILMEGVTDEKNLLTNKISYQRMAKSLGLSEQHQAFVPAQGEIVDADVDVDVFTPDTIDLLNLAMLIHGKGLTLANLQKVLQYSPRANLNEEVINDLLHKRNQHLVVEIQSHLSESDNIMVPWGVAHMPGIAREIQKAGFRLDETQDYMLIQFHRNRSQHQRPLSR